TDVYLRRFIGGSSGILWHYRGLHRDGTLHGIDRAGEVGDHAVPGGVEDAAAVRRDQPVDDSSASLQPGKRGNLVARHQPAVASYVGGEDRSKFAHYRLGGHLWLLSVRL